MQNNIRKLRLKNRTIIEHINKTILKLFVTKKVDGMNTFLTICFETKHAVFRKHVFVFDRYLLELCSLKTHKSFYLHF